MRGRPGTEERHRSMAPATKPKAARTKKPDVERAASKRPEVRKPKPNKREARRSRSRGREGKTPEPPRSGTTRPLISGPWQAHALTFLLLTVATIGLYS